MMIAAAVSCGKTTVSWKEGEPVDKRYSMFTLEIQQPPAGTDWYIWFSQFRTPVALPDEADGLIEHVSGTLYRFIPTVDTHGKPLQVMYQAKTNGLKSDPNWVAKHPDWNKVVLVPVSTTVKYSSDYYGNTTSTVSAVGNQLGLSSTKLVGGPNSPIEVKVIYAKFND